MLETDLIKEIEFKMYVPCLLKRMHIKIEFYFFNYFSLN